MKNLTLLFFRQTIVFDAYNLFICERLLQRRWEKWACIRPISLTPVALSCDTTKRRSKGKPIQELKYLLVSVCENQLKPDKEL